MSENDKILALTKEPPINEDERLKLYAYLHSHSRKCAWALGNLLWQEQKLIQENVKRWVEHGKPEPAPPYDTMEDFFLKNESALGFKRRTGYLYMKIAKVTDYEIAVSLGPKKLQELLRIEDRNERGKLEAKAVAENWTAEYIKTKVDRVLNKKEPKVERDDGQFNYEVNGSKVLFTFKSKEDAEVFLGAFNYYESKIHKLMEKMK